MNDKSIREMDELHKILSEALSESVEVVSGEAEINRLRRELDEATAERDRLRAKVERVRAYCSDTGYSSGWTTCASDVLAILEAPEPDAGGEG